MNVLSFKDEINKDAFRSLFIKLYGDRESDISYQKHRYLKAIDSFEKLFPTRKEIKIYSAPGRTEIGGNHTDHQHGVVLAGAVNLDAIAVVSFHMDGVVRVKSHGYDLFVINLNDLEAKSTDTGTVLIIKGIITKYLEIGVEVQGFDMYCTSDVMAGGGISSSAAFETLICTVINQYYNSGKSSPFEIAQIGWFAENEYFGKRCGLLDQSVSSFGGLVSIDFMDRNNPSVEKIYFDFEKEGYCLYITDTKSSHESLTDDYEAITNEMRQVASYFNCDVLNDVDEREFYENIHLLRNVCSDRAILRSIHFFDETKRAREESKALKNNDINSFLQFVRESGDSSSELLQNLYSNKTPTNQEIPLAIALSKKVLKDIGAVRVHGGGFAGTIQAFVPLDLADKYVEAMERIFGMGSCHLIKIRPFGGVEIKK